MNLIRALILGAFFVPLFIYYVYYRMGRLLKYYQKDSKRRTILLTAIFLLTMVSLTTTVSIICVFLLTSALLLDGFYWVVGLFVKKKIKLINKWYQNGTFILLLTILLTGYGYWNAHEIRQTTYLIETNKQIPNGELTIVQISDLHFGVTLNERNLTDELEKINRVNPDLIVLTGDIFDENTTKKEMKFASKQLGSLNSKYGIYYILGNHDPNYYARDKKYTEEEMLEELRKNRIHLLLDEVMEINSDFYLVGRKDFSLGKREDLGQLTENLDFNKLVILLDHQPLDLYEAENIGIDLQLSGHTHAGQIWPLGLLMDLTDVYSITYGKYQSQGYTLLVSSGMGGWNYPFRTSKCAEYVVVKMKQK